MIREPRKGDPLDRRSPWDELWRAAVRSFRFLPPLYGEESAGQVVARWAPPPRFFARITARAGTAYSWQEVYRAPAGWAALPGGRTGVADAWEFNRSATVQTGTVVWLMRVPSGEWRFERPGEGDCPGSLDRETFQVNMDYLAAIPPAIGTTDPWSSEIRSVSELLQRVAPCRWATNAGFLFAFRTITGPFRGFYAIYDWATGTDGLEVYDRASEAPTFDVDAGWYRRTASFPMPGGGGIRTHIVGHVMNLKYDAGKFTLTHSYQSSDWFEYDPLHPIFGTPRTLYYGLEYEADSYTESPFLLTFPAEPTRVTWVTTTSAGVISGVGNPPDAYAARHATVGGGSSTNLQLLAPWLMTPKWGVQGLTVTERTL